MIFGLPALIGFLPMVIYLYLAFKEKDLLVTVVICVLVGAILTGQTPVSLSAELARGLQSFLGLIGFIIMMGAGLGEVLTETKVARNLVNVLIKKVGIKSQNQAIIVTMLISTLLVALLGTLAGANAMITPILIPIVASFGVTPNALAVILHGAGACGLFLGPFVPPVITLMGLTNLSYGEYLVNIGLPVATLVLLTTYYTGRKVQKQYEGIETYSQDDLNVNENFIPTPETTRATLIFALVMIGMLVYGIFAKAGAAYAVLVMLVVAFSTGLAAGKSLMEIIQSLIKGSTKMFWLFFMFVLYDPFLNFVTMTGAFEKLGELLKPLIEVSGDIGFIIISTLVGVFGVSGAAVAQSVVLNDLFKNIVADINLPMTIWGTVLLIGSQITSFAYPTGDMIGQMGLAHSKDLKSMIKNGIFVTIVMIIYIIVRAVIYSL